MDPRDLEERCAAIAWMNAFLDADGDPNEWAKLPEHMRRTLLSLFPLPRLRAGGTSLSKWERLAFAVPLSRRLACRRPRSPVEVVHVQGSPSPDPADPASTHGGPINTSRSQDPLSRHPAPRQPSSCSGPPSQRRRPRAPTPEVDGAAYWGPRLLDNDEPSELVTPDSMPKALWNAMDPRPNMPLDKKAKFNDNLSKPGLANDQLHPAFIFTYSLDLHSGTALDVYARAHALAAAARSIQLDVDGHLLSPKKDPSRFTNRSELREHAGYWHKVGWIFSPITYQDINAIKEAIEFVYSRCVQRSETYHVKAIQKGSCGYTKSLSPSSTLPCTSSPILTSTSLPTCSGGKGTRISTPFCTLSMLSTSLDSQPLLQTPSRPRSADCSLCPRWPRTPPMAPWRTTPPRWRLTRLLLRSLHLS